MMFLFVVAILIAGIKAQGKCLTPNGEEAQCIALRHCPILKDAITSGNLFAEEFVEASACGNGTLLVCCGSSAFSSVDFKDRIASSTTNGPASTVAAVLDEETKKKLRRKYAKENLLATKKYCGQQHWDDYIHTNEEEDGVEASVNEFPWMLIVDSTRRCTGFLISRGYFITTALCYFYRTEESKTIIGVHHIKKDKNCVQTMHGEDCTEKAEVLETDKVFNIGRRLLLVKLKQNVDFTDFIRPICLPSSPEELPTINGTVLTSGWGEASEEGSEDYVLIKKRSRLTVVDYDRCHIKFIPRFDYDICAVPYVNSSVTTCWGDEGGPLMYQIYPTWYAVGVVDSASDCTLGDPVSSTGITQEMVDRIVDFVGDDYCETHKTKNFC